MYIEGKSENKHYILAIMLAVTNHWVSLLAHKVNDKTELLFFDSRNVDYLKWNEK